MLDTQSLLIRAGELGISSTHAHQALAEGGREGLARLICETEPRGAELGDMVGRVVVPAVQQSLRILKAKIKKDNPSPAQETEDDE